MSTPPEDWQPKTMPAMLIMHAARYFGRLADQRLRDLGISTGQLPVLVALKNGARLSQKDLTRLAGVEQPSMAQLLARMERDGLIERQPDPTDRRSSLVSLSDKALEQIGPAKTILAQGNREAIAGLSDSEVETLVTLLLRVLSNVREKAAPE